MIPWVEISRKMKEIEGIQQKTKYSVDYEVDALN
jgi:hypothetical protein